MHRQPPPPWPVSVGRNWGLYDFKAASLVPEPFIIGAVLDLATVYKPVNCLLLKHVCTATY